jgi:mRNA interferase MazF
MSTPDSNSIRRGEVWQVNLDPTVGDEMRKNRPCVVLTADGLGRLRLKTVVPITDPAKGQPLWQVPISPTPANGLSKPSVADAFQVRTLSLNRFTTRLGKLTAQEMDDIASAVAVVLEIK